MTEVAVLADDLSGAAETAATFLMRTTRIGVTLAARSGSQPEELDVQVRDTDSRHLVAPVAADRVTLAVTELGDVSMLVKKIDSLLRGNVLAELLAVRSLRPNIVVAPALPAAGRTTSDGRILLNGVPLAETPFWHAETEAAPTSIAALLSPLTVTSVTLNDVRATGLELVLRETLAAGRIPVCDADTDGDLDLIAAAAATLDRPVLVGSAGLGAAVARLMPAASGPSSPWPASPEGPVLVVVGTAAHGIDGQIDALRQFDPEIVVATPGALLDNAGLAALTARVTAATAPVTVVRVDPDAPVDPRQARPLALALAAAVAPAAARAGALVLTGGETARAVLDRLGITQLQPLHQVHHGAVVCAGPGGQRIVTRPGSFGGPDSLLAIVRALHEARAHLTKESS